MAHVEKKPEQMPAQEIGKTSHSALHEAELDDDMIGEGIVDVDESTLAANGDQIAARRRLEEYFEEKRLREEIEDDFS